MTKVNFVERANHKFQLFQVVLMENDDVLLIEHMIYTSLDVYMYTWLDVYASTYLYT